MPLFSILVFCCALNGYKPMPQKVLDEVFKDLQEEQGVVTIYV